LIIKSSLSNDSSLICLTTTGVNLWGLFVPLILAFALFDQLT
jgi:hypothetical protein